ncbi:endonuclease/exonuclease/phosphatase family protein [Halobium salinum]|uniref:Endonuclease/exonuclease/phosphatase family protein n=1 Tax=Halobium salinum TaxID=1364940 RepID=A0ABD5PC46_9EURY|nr:endonuclease/exonuclease/phosphatase family protein [Halobium salinum]
MTSSRHPSRRRLLRDLGAGAVGLAGAGALGARTGSRRAAAAGDDARAVGTSGAPAAATDTTAATAATAETRVMTRNLALGADLTRLYDAEDDELDRVAGDLVATAEESRFDHRAAAIAAEIEATGPALVGLQEAVRVEVDSEVRFDYLNVLRRALRERGLDYEVVARATNADVTLPAAVDGLLSVLTVVDRDAVLVRGDVATENARSGRFDAALEVKRDGRTVTVPRGWAAVDATAAGRETTFVTTHLEAADAAVRRAQARELVGAFEDRESVVVAGDVNDGPDDAAGAYQQLARTFEDAAAVAGDPGPTCCQNANLRNRRSRLSTRLDHVFVRGPLVPTAVTLTGEDGSDRVDTPDGTVWPSDHAGVVATLRVEAESTTTAAPTNTPTESATDASTSTPTAGSATTGTDGGATNDGRDTTVSVPGFGVTAALVALGTALAAALRRRGDD